MTIEEVLKQSLEALEFEFYDDEIQRQLKDAITSLRKAIADIERQKPYGYFKLSNGKFYVEVVGVPDIERNPNYLALYTHPQPKQPLINEFAKKYWKACDSSNAKDWLDAALIAQQILETSRPTKAAHGIGDKA